MRNPSRKPQPPLWREIVVTIYRGICSDRNVWGNARKARVRWIAGGLLCVALAAGISLARHGGMLLSQTLFFHAFALLPGVGIGGAMLGRHYSQIGVLQADLRRRCSRREHEMPLNSLGGK